MSNVPRIAVIYYSATGNIAAMSHAFAEGARTEGAEVRCRRVLETAHHEAIAVNSRWQHFVDNPIDDTAQLIDLEWAQGIAIGSPTRFGGPAHQLKAFLDTTGGLWSSGELATKVCTSFTAASTGHGGLESTILAMNNHFYHWGSLILPLGYLDKQVAKANGNPYGASFVSRSGAPPDEDSLAACRSHGARLARTVHEIQLGRQAE